MLKIAIKDSLFLLLRQISRERAEKASVMVPTCYLSRFLKKKDGSGVAAFIEVGRPGWGFAGGDRRSTIYMILLNLF